MTPEQKAREQIDAMLITSGWLIQHYMTLDLTAGPGIAVREVPLESGPCDYLPIVNRVSVGVVKPKQHGATISAAADQSGRYAAGLPDFLRSL